MPSNRIDGSLRLSPPLRGARGVIGRAVLALACALLLGACSVVPFRREPPRPGRTTLSSPLVELPAQAIGNYLVIEAKWDRFGPYHFVVDTGSSVTLVSPTLARRYPGRGARGPTPRVRVTAADGHVAELPGTSLRRLELGDAKFDEVPAVVYDLAALSAHLGVRIDGVLGFPLFREVRLTLDYPGRRVRLQPSTTSALTPGIVIGFDDARNIPLIHVKIGDRSVTALIDSGSDALFSLNPVGVEPRFVVPPRTGVTVGTIAGDRTQQIARIGETLAIGDYLFPQPIVDLSDELSAIGGGILKHFAVTFDQEHNRVTFYRDSRDPIVTAARRSAGMSFNKTPAYWRVVGVIPGSPAAAAGIQPGDLVTRINGEAVANWTISRYEQLVAESREITFSFLEGTQESSKPVGVFELVP